MNIVRNWAEHFAKGRRIRRTLPNGVPMFVSPDAQLKYLAREFDADLIALARQYVGAESVVWDVGANCGVLAFASAGAKQIVAVEADPFLCNLIQQSAEISGIDVLVVAAAAYSAYGLAEFSIARRGRASNHLSQFAGSTQSAGERNRIIVPTITLDALLERALPPTFIKIDVEGAEFAVLQGASTILTKHRPVVYLESGDETRDACRALFAVHGYSMETSDQSNWICKPA